MFKIEIIYQEWLLYVVLFILFTMYFFIKQGLYKDIYENKVLMRIKFYYMALSLLTPLVIIYPLQAFNINLFEKSNSTHFMELPVFLMVIQNSIYSIISILILLSAYTLRKRHKISIEWFKKLTNAIGVGLVFTILLQIYFSIIPYNILSKRIFISKWHMLTLIGENIKHNAIKFFPILVLILFVGLFRQRLKQKQFDEMTETDQTTGNFGSASWATKKDLKKINAYDPKNGPFVGADFDKKPLYLPLCNKLTLSPPGGGKSSASSIIILLLHDGPSFVFDIKGELVAVTGRYRSEVLGRHVVIIDPFDLMKQQDFAHGNQTLLKKYHFNPFDWIPENKKERDRMINTFAASFVINEGGGGGARHFDDNAKILIRGYIDYMMSLEPSQRNLTTLFNLMSEGVEEANATFEQMSQLEGRAGAAANQIHRVGADERGSILSTSYRQIDWMGDSNLQETLSCSNFDLNDFLKGNMDIFVVLPEDQVQEHNRLFRMTLSILMAMIVKTPPDKLPKKKMLFLLEELAQLGYTPDVEKCIEVLRARKVVIWTVFQTLSQIEAFQKPDLFKSVPLKQIFTNDDTKTMEWIQKLGGKKTVLTKTLSTNQGDSRQKFQSFSGTVSSGDGESIHETGVDLIQMNEIRELPYDEQIIFLQSHKPIRCKKVRYFEHADFFGKFDVNPLEENH